MTATETPNIADQVFGGRENAVKVLNNIDRASTALAQASPTFTQEMNSTLNLIKDTTSPAITTTVKKAAIQAVIARTHHTTRSARLSEIEMQKQELAHKTDNIIEGIVKATYKMQQNYQFRPDKIILTQKQYDDLSHLSYNPYSMHLSTFIDSGYPASIFGINLEIGKKAGAVLNPITELYAVSNNFAPSTQIHSRELTLREEIFVPICDFHFKGYIITRKTRGDPVLNATQNEMQAIETLREMITEPEFRRYLKYGFILVKGKSGSVYQIFRNHSHTKIWLNGKVIEEVCVRIKDSNIPRTDNVIAFKVMVETNEDEFKKLGNVYKMTA